MGIAKDGSGYYQSNQVTKKNYPLSKEKHFRLEFFRCQYWSVNWSQSKAPLSKIYLHHVLYSTSAWSSNAYCAFEFTYWPINWSSIRNFNSSASNQTRQTS